MATVIETLRKFEKEQKVLFESARLDADDRLSKARAELSKRKAALEKKFASEREKAMEKSTKGAQADAKKDISTYVSQKKTLDDRVKKNRRKAIDAVFTEVLK
ncbi:hypothetical protein H6504_02955 [Candidatus Woesearchaeota archaeon]|nr:hypothetical protein [Candidatus Woesearchaeota archaeon]